MTSSFPAFDVQQGYRAMDFLLESGEAIQREVFHAVADLLHLEVDLLFFDTTSTYFETEDEDDEFRRCGYCVFQQSGGHCVIGEKMSAGKPSVEAAMSHPGRFKTVRDNLEVKDITIGDGEARRRYVLVRNLEEARRDAAQREQHLEALQHELERLKALDGKYLIQTSDDTLSSEDVALGYKQLLKVEAAFRTLKQSLALRPVYHRKEERIRAHVLLCWLALMLIRIVENQTGRTWRDVRSLFQRVHLIQAVSSDGTVLQRTELTDEHRGIHSALDLPEPQQIWGISTN